MAKAVSALLDTYICEAIRLDADRLLLGNLPEGYNKGTYPIDMAERTPKDVAGPRLSVDDVHAIVREAESSISLEGMPFESEYPNGRLPVHTHLPQHGGWFETEGFSCHLLPHIVLELETRCRRIHDVHVTMLKNGSYVIRLGKTK